MPRVIPQIPAALAAATASALSTGPAVGQAAGEPAGPPVTAEETAFWLEAFEGDAALRAGGGAGGGAEVPLFNGPDGRPVVASLAAVSRDRRGAPPVGRGRLELGGVEGRFLVSAAGGAAAGGVWLDDAAYDLAVDPTSGAVIMTPVRGDLPLCGGAAVPDAEDLAGLPPEPEAGDAAGDGLRGLPGLPGSGVGDAAPAAGLTAATVNDSTVVRVLVAFTDGAFARAGGTIGTAHVWATAAVGTLNTGLSNSGEPTRRYELAGVMHAPGLSDGLGGRELLDRITRTSFAEGAGVRAHRDVSRADLVALVSSMTRPDVCGVAWRSPFNSGFGYSVTDFPCAIGGLTFAHEVGHNMGCSHARPESTSSTRPYSFGHRFFGVSGRQHRTIMAYRPGSRTTHFSNPTVLFDGTPTGIAGSADNVRMIRDSFSGIARWRRGVWFPDCDGDGLDDHAQIAADPSLDHNGDGVLNRCEYEPCDGDFNGNEIVDENDVAGYLATFVTSTPFAEYDGVPGVNFFDVMAFLDVFDSCLR